jgi:DNA polymerase/3'-5' exonuclease PolX
VSATTERVPVSEAMGIAEQLIAYLEPACERIVIAGSIRRGLPTVGDIELVAVPRLRETVERDMFGEVAATRKTDLLDERLDHLLRAGLVAKRTRSDGKTFWGPKAKYLTFEGMNVDLFTPEAQRFGLILMIRTGPAVYSHQLVTEKGKQFVTGYQPNGRPIMRYGLLPSHLRVQEGWLTSKVSGIRIPTPEERDFYDYTRLPYLDPWERH